MQVIDPQPFIMSLTVLNERNLIGRLLVDSKPLRRKRDGSLERSDELGGCVYSCNGCVPRDVLCYGENQNLGCPYDEQGASQAENEESSKPSS